LICDFWGVAADRETPRSDANTRVEDSFSPGLSSPEWILSRKIAQTRWTDPIFGMTNWYVKFDEKWIFMVNQNRPKIRTSNSSKAS
jgi:hypothetical protein